MAETNQEEITSTQTLSGRDLASVIILGVIAGVITWGVYELLLHFVVPGLFCRDSTTSLCETAPSIMDGVSLVIGAVVALLGLIRLRVFRPLLVVLATIIALGGLAQRADVLAWYFSLLACGVLFGLAYGLFAWMAKIRLFWTALLVSAVLVIVTRLVLFG